MDTFFEQIVSMKKDGKAIAAIIGIWLLAVVLAFLLFTIGMQFIGALSLLLVFGLFYGAFKLSTRFNIEYEYIVTNGTMDIDKIISKSSRKRVVSFELQTVSRLEKFTPAQLNNINPKEIVAACNLNDPEAYLMVSSKEGKGNIVLVFAPDERVRGAIIKFVPKFIANSAFR